METKILTQVAGCNIIGSGPMIEGPIEVGDWYCVPMEQYKSTMPPEANQAIARFVKSGVVIKGYIVAEDIREYQAKQKAKPSPPKVESDQVAAVLGVVFAIMGVIGLAMLQFVLALVAVDPILIAVTEDDQWLELHSWD